MTAILVARPRPRRERGIAEEALAARFAVLCRGGTWQGLAREFAWRAVTGGHRDPRQRRRARRTRRGDARRADRRALWAVEKSALDGWDEFVGEHGGGEAAGLAAARLDAREEAERLVEAAYARALDALLATSRRAA